MHVRLGLGEPVCYTARMAGGIDYQGISLVIAAVGTATASVVGAIVSVVSLIRGNRRDVVMAEIKKHVNGMNQMIAAGARAEGVIEGVAAERANPRDKPREP